MAAAGSLLPLPVGDDDVRADRQAVAGEDDLHVVLVHHHRGREHAGPDVADVRELEHALQRAVLAERPVQQREDDVDLAELARRLPGLEHRQRPLGGAQRDEHARPRCRRPPGCGRARARAAPARRRRGPSGRPWRCRRARRRRRSRSIARSTPAAVAQETACSEERPPKTRATRGRWPAGPGSGLWGVSTVLIARDPIARHPAAGARAPVLRLACARGPPAPRRPRPRLDPGLAPAAQPRVPGAGSTRPLELTSTYVADGPVNYARGGNPTWTAFEDALGGARGWRGPGVRLGHGGDRRGPVARPRRRCRRRARPTPTTAPGVILQDLAAAGRMTVRRVDISDTAAVTAALQGADLLWLESPTNPMLEVADLPTLIAAAHEQRRDRGRRQHLRHSPRPAAARRWAPTSSMHSVTKFLAGHTDVILGATVDGGHRRRPGRVRAAVPPTGCPRRHRRTDGDLAGPARACAPCTCGSSAPAPTRPSSRDAWPATRPCERVRYPGLGAIVAIEVRRRRRGAPSGCASATRLWVHATSLGGVESLIERRRRHPSEPLTVPENLLRSRVGIEDVDDLWRDLAQALSTLGGDGTARG